MYTNIININDTYHLPISKRGGDFLFYLEGIFAFLLINGFLSGSFKVPIKEP